MVNGNVPVERTRLSENTEQAVDQTVKRMAEIAYGEYGSRSSKIRALGINIVRDAGVTEKDYYGEILAIHEWIKKNIRYIRDPVNQETLSHPEETVFNSKAGDCDDMVVLEMALLGAIGIKSHPVVVGMQPGMYSHVYMVATVPPGRHRMAGKKISLDPIMKNWPAGREAPRSRVKARKDYPQLEALMMLNGNDADLGDIYSSMDSGSNLGAYATGPSYLDTEYSGAEDIMVTPAHTPDITHDLVLSNTPKAVQSKEGVDGLFGMDIAMEATDSRGPEAMFSRGPIIGWQAKGMHRPLSAGGKYIRKHYEGGEMEARMNRARGKSPVNAGTSPNRKVVVVNDGRKEKTPQNADLTAQEQSDELDGLYGMILERTHGIRLAGLGSEDDPATQEEVREAATLSWFARFKAKSAAARAGWLKQRAENLRRMGRPEQAQSAAKQAQTQRVLAKKAIAVAKEGVELEKAAEKASPQADATVKDQQAALEVAEQEEATATEADQKPSLEGFFNRHIKKSRNWGDRRKKLLNTRRQRMDEKTKALEAGAKKVTNRLRNSLAQADRRREKIEAPVAIRSMQDPSKQGRRDSRRRTNGFPVPDDGAPKSREGLRSPFSRFGRQTAPINDDGAPKRRGGSWADNARQATPMQTGQDQAGIIAALKRLLGIGTKRQEGGTPGLTVGASAVEARQKKQAAANAQREAAAQQTAARQAALRERDEAAAREQSDVLQAAAPANEATPRDGVIVPQQGEAMDPNVNKRATKQVDGLGALPTINTPIAALNSPLVQYGAVAAGLYFFLKNR